MIKKIFKFLTFIFILTLLSFNVFSLTESQEINNFLEGNSLNDLIEDITLQLIETNFTAVVTWTTPQGLEITFSGFEYASTIIDEEDIVFGRYDIVDNSILIDVETIYNYPNPNINASLSLNFGEYNYTIKEYDIVSFQDKIHSTLIHELTHYAVYTNQFMYLDSIYNITFIEFPFVSNTAYFENLFYIELEHKINETPNYNYLPYFTLNTLKFDNVFSNYPTSQFYDEIGARLTAVCLQEKQNYSTYIEMYEISDYTFCDRFSFPPFVTTNFNLIAKDVIEGFTLKFRPSLYHGVSMVQLTGDSFSIIGTLIEVTIDIIINIIPILLVSILISIMIYIFYVIGSKMKEILNHINFKKK